MNKYLQNIAEEKAGFSFGESWRYSEDSLVSLLPILRKTSKRRNYLLLSEVSKAEIRDTGMINKVEVYNGESKPIYIRMGEIFSGKTQERTAIRSYVIMPKEKVQVDVRCIYASKGINASATMTSNGIAPTSFDSMFSTSAFKMRSVEQRDVWKNTENVAQSFVCSLQNLSDSGAIDIKVSVGDDSSSGGTQYIEVPASSDDLKGNIDRFGENIKKILEKVPYFENQIGIATLDLQGVNGIECFDLTQSWKALRGEIIKKEGENISKQEKKSPFEYKHSKAVRSVRDVLGLNYEERTVFKSKDYRIVALQGDSYVGELVELKNDLIHLTIIKK